MSTITFDTLKYVDALQSAGISDAHARAEANALRNALSEAINDSIVTKRDLGNELGPIKSDIAVIKWMIGFVLVFVLGLFWKQFA
jgi:hypothetical protein